MIKYILAYIFLVAAIAVVVMVIAVATPRLPTPPEAELARLAAQARLSWADYGEGIKAALGATPAAQWHGTPVEARLAGSSIEVRFSLLAPWHGYDFGMPILLRDPEGRVAMPVKYERTNTGGVYTFRLDAPSTPLSVPWIELRFPPNEEQRVVFDTAGVWRKAAGP